MFRTLFFLLFLYFIPIAAQSQISLREQIGQMLIIGFKEKTINSKTDIVRYIDQYNIGGVILFDYDVSTKTYDRNIENPKQLKQLNHDLQLFTAQSQLKHLRPRLPLIISVDYEGGSVSRLESAYGFPATLSAAVIGKKGFASAEVMAESMAKTLSDYGFNLNFAPVLDVNVNPHNPVIGLLERSFSNLPDTVVAFATIYSRHFLTKQIQCAYKHFPGHGSSLKDSHSDFVDVSDTWLPQELVPFRKVIQSKHACSVMMTAHIVNRKLDPSGLPASLSYEMIHNVLRKQLQFKGLVITDDMQMKAISDRYGLGNALELSINAGADMLLFGNNLSLPKQNPVELITIIEGKVRSGAIKRSRIEEAYQRIVTLKKELVHLNHK